MRSACHAYHCWADGEWLPAASEHVAALAGAGFRADQIIVGLTGGSLRQAQAREYFTMHLSQFGPVSFACAPEGFEQVTLTRLRDWARQNASEDAAVLYAHTKGAMNLAAITTGHRRIMTRNAIGRWQDALAALGTCDVAGSFLTGPPGAGFTGNFWWARSTYLATLPEPATGSRHDAEAWIGLGSPRTCELNPEFTYQDMVRAVLGRPEEQDVTGIRGLQGTSGLLPAPRADRGLLGGSASGTSIPGCQ